MTIILVATGANVRDTATLVLKWRHHGTRKRNKDLHNTKGRGKGWGPQNLDLLSDPGVWSGSGQVMGDVL
jgi:hypothetical protein